MADPEVPPEADPTPEVPTETPDSVLNSVKRGLGVGTDYDPFDAELIMHINSVFSTLHQLGVGPEDPFSISGESDVWSTFIGENKTIESVKTYVYAKVRLIFDPPTTSYGIQAFEKMCTEFEWRLNVEAESKLVEFKQVEPWMD